jgi:hypothetical protein
MAEAVILLLERLQRERAETAPATAQQAAKGPAHKPIWEVAAEIRERVPADEWAALPADGAAEHDHYIYGTPKRCRP